MRLIFTIVKTIVLFTLFTFVAVITGVALTVIGLVMFLFGRKPLIRTYSVRMGGGPDFSEPREMKDVTPLHPESLPSGHGR